MDESRKRLTAINLTMMALGTVIGGSFFLGSVVSIRAAGPAVLISYILGGALVYFILSALSDMTIAEPSEGSFRNFSEKMYGPGLGFVLGWVYWTGLAIGMSSEAVAASILIKMWIPSISLPVMGSIIIILVTFLNLFGADKLSKLESSLASIKIFAVIGFIVLGVMLIFGFTHNWPKVGFGALLQEPWLPSGIGGIAGSLLIVMFSYAGFEIISLAASETKDPQKTVPKAIFYTVISLVGLYVITIIILLPLVPTSQFTTKVSPLVFALTKWHLSWVGGIMNVVLVTAIFSTMLASMFGLGRMIRSLADKGQAPLLLKDKGDIPYRGILFSGAGMLVALLFSFILPSQVYLFLASSGGFSLLFTYLVILITHYKYRKENGCPPEGKCQLPGYPVSSWLTIAALVGIILSMPLIPGQGYGLLAGIILIAMYTAIYRTKSYFAKKLNWNEVKEYKSLKPQTYLETSEEIAPDKSDDKEKE